MFSYKPLLKLMEQHGISFYDLTVFGITRTAVYRIRNDMPVSMKTLDSLCRELECNISDIIEYIPDSTEKQNDNDTEK